MKTSENIIEISKAMNLAQREMRPAIKDSTNPHFRSKYSDLASVMDAIREPIGNNGLSIWQDATLEDLGVSVTTRIVHISGQWVEFGPLTIPIGKKDAHAVGSACSYGKRYALCAALGVVSDDDDDGNKAVASSSKKHIVEPNKMVVTQSKLNVDHSDQSLDMVENTNETINEYQWKELNALITQCDSEFKKNIWEYFESQEIRSYSDMDLKTFRKSYKGCMDNIAKNKQKSKVTSEVS